MKRVVVTGMGLISSIGNDPDSAKNRLHTYKNTVQTVSLYFYRNI